jgi:riboflavin biosynthesis pyrimidine reductase
MDDAADCSAPVADGRMGDEAQGMVDLPGFDDLEKRPKLKIQSLERVGDDIRIVARL